MVDFADDVSKCVYEEAYEAFKARHLTRDEFVVFSAKNSLAGFVKKLAVHDPDYPVPSWMSSTCFCLASCCCMTWPYRFMVNSSVSSYNYRIIKKVLARPVAVTNQPRSVGDVQPVPATESVEPTAPLPPPPSYSSHRRDDMDAIPVMPFDQIPSVPPPSYEEFAADPAMFRTPKHGIPELIPLSEMTS